ncbi:glycoside hydrolase domain-containing protein [Haliangium ochraceum]|uniref:Uncharacterized protein n=1 Tax=Haliangium ochraceum (strain DSM 14365 / JCM 11303 / SMP-2) TaxID=502025 RepID=D0LNX2_HALO1|nr:glycoside hydrolase domain-containing protein [Haliangium ochraceum]ACY18798.1 conserved hypothetical protein [Haliangium ochraceum DSM 14365]
MRRHAVFRPPLSTSTPPSGFARHGPAHRLRRRALTLLLACASLFCAASAHAELASLWALDDGTKIAPEATGHPLTTGNAVYASTPPTVSLFGLRNETVAFQVILEGGSEDTDGLVVTLDAVGPIANRADQPSEQERARSPQETQASEAAAALLDRPILIYEQGYLPVRERSHSLTWLPGSEAEPAAPGERVPDILIPHRQPLRVPAGENRGVWVDVYIPRDTPAGIHRGTLRVSAADGGACGLDACELAISLEVLARSLPEVAPVKTLLWASAVNIEEPERTMARYFEDYPSAPADDLHTLRLRHFQLARRFRITLVGGALDEPTPELEARLSGDAFTRAAGYTGAGEGVGQDLVGIHFYGGELSPEDAARWRSWLDAHAPEVDAFLYVVDEPSDRARYPEFNERARRAHPIDAFVTSRYGPHFSEFDIFAVPTSDYFATAASMRGTDKKLWVYNGRRPFAGSFAIDDVAISPRVNPWIQYRHGIPRWFYWEATYYQDFQGSRGDIDVLRASPNFSNRFGDRVHGDGLLMYPGRDRLFPDSDLGLMRPLPSIRLANWRRGIEDVGYLELVRGDGHGAFVDRLVGAMVPRSLDQMHEDEPVTWPEDGARWHQARRMLFDTLRTGAPPAIDEVDWAALGRPDEGFGPPLRRWLRRWLGPLVRSPNRRFATTMACVAALIGAFLLRRWWRRRRSEGDSVGDESAAGDPEGSDDDDGSSDGETGAADKPPA